MAAPNQTPTPIRAGTFQVEVRGGHLILLGENADIDAPEKTGSVVLTLRPGVYLIRVRRCTEPLPKGGDVDPVIEVWRY